ncbi:MAG TPA: cysteine hydrolase family protein [Dehalococcoidia bacterium]|nr:cysteine hydrolase family protein [Dehalococcoidia bacterium]
MNGTTVNARPYPWPFHGRLQPARVALLTCEDAAAGTHADRDGPLPRLRTVVETIRARGGTIVWLPNRNAAAGAMLACTTTGPSDITVGRPVLSGFTGTGLDLILRARGITDIVLAGFPLELGADCTMREANDLGYECLMLTDCSSALSPETAAAAIRSIQMSGGIFGAVAGSDELLRALGAE